MSMAEDGPLGHPPLGSGAPEPRWWGIIKVLVILIGLWGMVRA